MSLAKFSSLVFSLAVLSNAYTLADAERAYVTKDWPTAKAAYSAVCPTLAGSEQVSCVYWHSLALSQTGKAEDFKAAGKKLDSLIQKVSPMDSLYSDLVMTRAQFEIYLKKYGKARESLRHAVECSRNQQNPVFVQVCGVLQKMDKSKETAELCTAIKEGTLVATLAADSTVKDSTPVASNTPNAVGAVKPASEPIKPVETKSPVEPVPQVAAPVVTPAATQADSVPAKPAPAVEPAPVVEQPSEKFALQVGAFSKKENAEMLVAALKSRGVETRIVERISTDRVLYLVQTEMFESRDAAVKYGSEVFTPLKMEFTPVKNP